MSRPAFARPSRPYGDVRRGAGTLGRAWAGGGWPATGFWYLLSLRLLPVVPFPVGSIAPALVGMRLPAFAAATALGIFPSTLVFASIGAGLGQVLARGGRPDPSALLSPPVLLPLLGLAALSLLAAWWRRRER